MNRFCISDISRHTQMRLKTKKQNLTDKLKFDMETSHLAEFEVLFQALNGPIRPPGEGPNFVTFLGLSLLCTLCHLTSCKKSETPTEWIFRYIDFFEWSVNYWLVSVLYVFWG